MILVLSQGCAANFGEGEKIARILSREDEILFQFPEAVGTRPRAIYLNVCTVKGNAGAIKLLKKAAETYPKVPIYVTGCAPKDFREEAQKAVPGVQFTSLKDLSAKGNILTAGNLVLRESPLVGIVNIEEGCLDACAFCSTHLIKGKLRSFPANEIVEQVKNLVDDGCLEIQLTGQDCACYGFDTGTNLAELVQNILAHVPGDYKIRLGMGNPRHVIKFKDQLLDCFADDRVYKFIHIPVQSGSNDVLKMMNRKHSVEDYVELSQAFTKRFPRFTLSTDLIVGFPGETAADFKQTLELVKKTRPTVCNITRFVPRPGTLAARMENTSDLPIPEVIKHERSALLAEAFQQIAQENNSLWIGDQETVVVEKPGHRPGTTIARNAAYRPVAIAGDYPAGSRLAVKITAAEPFALMGEVLN